VTVMQSPPESADGVPLRPLAYAANRDRLLDAAIELFAERGYEAVSTGSIAKAAGLTQSMVHYYFGTKAALWQAAVERVMRRRGERFDIAQSDLRDIDPLSRLKVIIRRFVRANADDPDLTRILVHEGLTRSDRVHWLSQRFMRPGYELFNKAIQDGIDAGQIHPQDPRDVTNIIVGASTLAFSLTALLADVYHEDESPWLDIDRLSDTLLDVLFHGLQVKRTLGNGDDAETL
jgi:TetR/AcrR family transcriptional regulator